jgi:hypothetical protein
MSRKRAVRRIECEGGCGLWWYHPSPEHRTKPVRWCPRCYRVKRRGLPFTAEPLGRSRLLTVAELKSSPPRHISDVLNSALAGLVKAEG